MADASNIKLPLQSLLAKLCSEGFDIGTSTILDLQRVIANVQYENVDQASDLKYLLSPIICRNKEEQEKYYRIFDEYLASLQETPIAPPATPERPNWKKWWWVAVPVLLAATVALVYLNQPKTPLPITKGIVEINASKMDVAGDTVGFAVQYADNANSKQYKTNWQIVGPDNYKKKFSNSSEVLTVFDSAGTYDVFATTYNNAGKQVAADTTTVDVYCEVPPTLEIIQQETDTTYGAFAAVIAGAKAKAPYQYHWFVNDVSVKGDSVMETSLLKNGQRNIISLKVDWPGQKIHCSVDSLTQQFEIQPPFQLTVNADPKTPLNFGKQYLWSNIFMAIAGLLLAPMLAAVFVWWRFLQPKPKQEEITEGNEPEEATGPFIIEFNNHQDKIMPETGISQLAEVLRKRYTSDIYKVDINKTIKRTIRRGGFPLLEYVPRTQPTDFLIFLDKEFPEGHLTRLFAYVIDRLKKEQVHLTVYTFSREPLMLSNEGLNHVLLPVDKVARLYPDTMLIIFSQAKAFFKSYDVVVKPWVTEKFKGWDTKMLLTPLAKKDWGAEELALYEAGFTVVPADMNSFNIISDEINQMIDRQMLKKEIVPETYGSRQFNFNRWRQVAAYLEKALGENKRQFNHISDVHLVEQWLCALAVYPHINWEVTIAVGKAFEDKFSAAGRLVNYTNLLVLSRISWMNDDQLMDSLRIEMLNKLEPEKEALARKVIVELMLEIEPAIPADSLVRNEFDFLHTTNKVLLNAHDQDRQTLSAEEWEQFKTYVDNEQVDWTLETYLQKGKNTLLADPENKTKNLSLDSYIKAKEQQEDKRLTEDEPKPKDRLKKLLKKASPSLAFLVIGLLSYWLLSTNQRFNFTTLNAFTLIAFEADSSDLPPAVKVNSLAVVLGNGELRQGVRFSDNSYRVSLYYLSDTAMPATLQVGLNSGIIESKVSLRNASYNFSIQPKQPDTSRPVNNVVEVDLPQEFNEIWQVFDNSGKFVSQLAFYLKPKLAFSKDDPKSGILQSAFIEAAQSNSNTYKVILYGDKKYEVAFFETAVPDVLKLKFCLGEQSSFDSLSDARKVKLPRCNDDLILKPLYLPVAGLKSDANALSIQLPQNGTSLYSSEQRKFESALRRFNTLSPNQKQLVTVSISLNGFYKFTADVQQRQAAIKNSTLGKAFSRARWLFKPFNGNAFQRDYVTIDFGGLSGVPNQPDCNRVFKSLSDAIINPAIVCKLDLSNQNLSSLPKEVYSFTNIQELNLLGTYISDVEVKTFQSRFPKCQVITNGIQSQQNQQQQQQQQQNSPKNKLLQPVLKAALGEVKPVTSKP